MTNEQTKQAIVVRDAERQGYAAQVIEVPADPDQELAAVEVRRYLHEHEVGALLAIRVHQDVHISSVRQHADTGGTGGGTTIYLVSKATS